MVPRMSASAPLDVCEDTAPASDAPGQRGLAGTPRPGAGGSSDNHGLGAGVALSFEVIPPRHDADAVKLTELLDTLDSYRPDYIAVTSSQRSGWLDGTAKLIEHISSTTAMRPLAHLACTAGTRGELGYWINTLVDAGVRGLLALRGDLPAGTTRLPGDHLQHADELIRLIRQVEAAQAARFAAGRLAVGVACYPGGHVESASPDEDLDVLLAKQRAGADFAITQLFFDAEQYLRFVQRARLAGVRIPLIPGIMPMTSLRRVERMSELSGQPVPQRVTDKLRAARATAETADPAATAAGPAAAASADAANSAAAAAEREVGLQLTVDLARQVLAGGAGSLHFYTHNDAAVTREVLTRIGIHPRAGRAGGPARPASATGERGRAVP